MKAAKPFETRGAMYELEIEIDAPRERVWAAITDETNGWWLPDFHVLGPDSTVTLDARSGGHLMETAPTGGSLLWYTVHSISLAACMMLLVGHTAPDWGGPTTTHLKLHVVEREGGSTLRVTDALFGRLDDKTVEGTHAGWTQLFTDGLKKHVES